MPEIELYLIVVSIFAVGEFLSHYVVSEYEKNSTVLIDTTKEIDLNQLFNFIEIFGMPKKENVVQNVSQNTGQIQENNASQNTIFAQKESPEVIGFQMQNKAQKKPYKPSKRGTSIDYDKMGELVSKGLRTKDIASVLNCSEASVRRFKNSLKKN